jgi:hypothetical protein
MDWINESIYGAVDNTERLRPTRTSLVLNLSTLLSDGFGNPLVSKNIKFFFWLLLKNRLNMSGMLRRRNMQLDSYDCELCLLQKVERLRHLFYRCPFAKNCWAQIGVAVPTWLTLEGATKHIKRNLRVPFSMKIIILMCWCIWIERNNWLFNGEDPLVSNCIIKFKREFDLVIHRSKESRKENMSIWLCNIP